MLAAGYASAGFKFSEKVVLYYSYLSGDGENSSLIGSIFVSDTSSVASV